MKITRFEDIDGWKKAQNLAVEIYKEFNSSRDYSFRDQICRASVSISNNIAEGFGRMGNAEFRHFLNIAISSCYEVISLLYLAKDLEYLEESESQILLKQCDDITRMLKRLKNSLKKSA